VKTTILGVGGWGSRVAGAVRACSHDRLVVVDECEDAARGVAERLGCEWSKDPFGYLGVSGTASSSRVGGRVVIATPPSERVRLVEAVLGGYGPKPLQIRIEKPLAETVEDAERIAGLCADAGVELTVGFTLLHDTLYQAAFDYLGALGVAVQWIDAVRIGRPARHPADPMVDLGIHAASIAAYLDVPLALRCVYSEACVMRRSTLHAGDARVVVDELAGTVLTPDGILRVVDADALTRDVQAWLTGSHRGTPRVALEAQRLVENAIDARMVAA
jgi:predicted dehydrogenase